MWPTRLLLPFHVEALDSRYSTAQRASPPPPTVATVDAADKAREDQEGDRGRTACDLTAAPVRDGMLLSRASEQHHTILEVGGRAVRCCRVAGVHLGDLGRPLLRVEGEVD